MKTSARKEAVQATTPSMPAGASGPGVDDVWNQPMSGAQSRQIRLTDPNMNGEMAALKRRIASDPCFGVSLLQKAGIVDANGKLTKVFGGA